MVRANGAGVETEQGLKWKGIWSDEDVDIGSQLMVGWVVG